MIKIRLFSALIRKIIIVFITIFLFSNNAKSQDTLEYISRIGYLPPIDVASYGNYLYLVDFGLIVLDFSDPTNATIVSHLYPPAMSLSELIISGNIGYAAWGGGGIKNIDFSNPANPVPIGNIYGKKFRHKNLQKNNNTLYAMSTSVSTDSIYLTSIDLITQTVLDSFNLETGFTHSAFEAKRFIVDGNYMYLTMGPRTGIDTSELHVFNISNPSNIIHIGSEYLGQCTSDAVIMQNSWYSLVKRNNYVYVASGFVSPKYRIKIVNVSSPSSPQLTTSWMDTIITGRSGDLELDSSGNYLLLTDLSAGFNVISISNDTVLSLCNRFNSFVPPYYTVNFEMRVHNSHAFLFNLDNYAAYTIDVTNIPCNAGIIDTIPLGHDWRDVSASNTSFIFTSIWDFYQLYTLDMNNPVTPSISKRTEVKGSGWGVDVEGNYAYCAMGAQNFTYPDSVASGGLIIFDISNPNNPIQKGWSPPDSLNIDVQVFVDAPNSNAYIIAGQPNSKEESYENHSSANPELRIIDVSNPNAINEIGSIAIPAQCRGVYKYGNYAYIAASSPDSCSNNDIIPITGLYIVNVSNPSIPVFAGSNWVEYNHPGKTAHTRSVYIKDTIAYIAHDTSLVILNVSNQGNPILVSETGLTKTQTMDVIGWDNYLFVLTQDALFAYDITNPVSPVLIDRANDFSLFPAKHLDVKPPYIYVLTFAGVYTFKFNALLTVSDIKLTSNNINIYPNPFSNSTTLQIMNGVNTNYELRIYDLFGREVKKCEIRNQKTEISRGNLPSGMYFYQVKDNKQFISSGKLIVQ
ncbi:MAG: T9SS type A sorting domain-containing protein [Bacteroidota bacterium]